ncbi:MAG: hypothetical protein R6U50_09395 [Desulfobacterales bacterium]
MEQDQEARAPEPGEAARGPVAAVEEEDLQPGPADIVFARIAENGLPTNWGAPVMSRSVPAAERR